VCPAIRTEVSIQHASEESLDACTPIADIRLVSLGVFRRYTDGADGHHVSTGILTGFTDA